MKAKLVSYSQPDKNCDGGDDFGHPRVYYTMVNGEAVCGYCNIKYILRKDDE